MSIRISIQEKKIILSNGVVLKPRSIEEFTLLVYLALFRKEQSEGEGFVTVEQIRRLPQWSQKRLSIIGNMIYRYISEGKSGQIIKYKRISRGPYWFAAAPDQIEFDLPVVAVRETLRLTPISESAEFDPSFLLEFATKLFEADDHFLLGDLGLALKNYKRILTPDFPLPYRLTVLYRISHTYERECKFNQALDDLQEIEALIVKNHIDDPLLVNPLYLQKGWIYYQQYNFRDAQIQFEKANKTIEGLGDASVRSEIYNHMGLACMRLSQKEKGLDYLMRSLQLRLQKVNYHDTQASCYNIGNCLATYFERYDEAIKWIELAKDICEKRKVGYDNAVNLLTLASLKLKLVRTDQAANWGMMIKEAKSLIEDGLRQAKLGNNLRDIATAYGLKASYFEIEKNDKEAMEWLRKAWDTFRDLDLSEDATTQVGKILRSRFPKYWDHIK